MILPIVEPKFPLPEIYHICPHRRGLTIIEPHEIFRHRLYFYTFRGGWHSTLCTSSNSQMFRLSSPIVCPTVASIATLQSGIPPKKSVICSLLRRFFRTAFPFASAPCSWNACLAISSPNHL